jgi:hypothetical protein
VSGWRLFYTLNGPAGLQLDTDSNSVPNQLGIIADNLLLSRLIPGDNDGKVSVSRAQVAGMKDFTVIMRTRLSCVGKES